MSDFCYLLRKKHCSTLPPKSSPHVRSPRPALDSALRSCRRSVCADVGRRRATDDRLPSGCFVLPNSLGAPDGLYFTLPVPNNNNIYSSC